MYGILITKIRKVWPFVGPSVPLFRSNMIPGKQSLHYLCRMHTSETNYLGGLRCLSTHLQSGSEIVTDAPTDNEGRGEAFSPTDLLATSLASCMITLMGIKGGKKNIELGSVRAETTKIMAANPRRVSEIHIRLIFPREYSIEDKQILEEAALNCPVAKSIHPGILQKITFTYGEQKES